MRFLVTSHSEVLHADMGYKLGTAVKEELVPPIYGIR